MATNKYLRFFDKNGDNYNFDYDEANDLWTGTVYFEEVATDLHANEHIFILEQVLSGSPPITDDYTHPIFDTQTSPPASGVWCTSWSDNAARDQIATYVVEEEDDTPYIAKYEEIEYNAVNGSYTVNAEGKKEIVAPESQALKINVLFVSEEEDIYERTLVIEDCSEGTRRTIARITFHGESVGEDERFRLMLENFGRQLDHRDALMMRDYDVKEGLPDWELINEKRKEMFMAAEDIFPYIGSYRGLVNIIKLFGYHRDLRIKEYWLNVDQKSEYYGKVRQVQINGLLTGENSPFVKHPVIPTTVYRKKGEFGLFYDITDVTGNVDDYGVPETVNTSQFTPEEVLVKLFAFKEKLQRDYMPVNAKIVDIVGEGIYFERYGIRTWSDPLKIFPIDVSIDVDFVSTPDQGYIRDLRRFRIMPLSPGLDLPFDRFTNEVNPYTTGQNYPAYAIQGLIDSIEMFYDELSTFPFPYNDNREDYYGDEPQLYNPYAYYALNSTPPEILSEGLGGCPVVLNAVIGQFTWDEMTGQSWDDLWQFTWDDLDFSNFYEIQWTIEKAEAPNPYYFQHRGPIAEYHRLPHFIPHPGKYKVTMELFDLFNNRSMELKEEYISVENHELEIIAFARWRDHELYTWDSTDNTWDDFGGSSWHFPIEGVAINDSPLHSQLLVWARYRNQVLAQILNSDTGLYEYLPVSDNPNAQRFGTINFTWDNMDIPWDEAYHTTWEMYDYHGEYLGGFRIYSPQIGDGIQIDDWPIFYFYDESPSIAPLSLEEACEQLNNATDNPGIQFFDYHVSESPDSPPFIHATGKVPGPSSWHFVTWHGISPVTGDEYTWKYPTWLQYQYQLQDLLAAYPSINEDHLFLDASPLQDLIDDTVGNLAYWQDAEYMKTEDPTPEFPLGERRGALPSWAGTGAFTAGDLRVFKNDFVAPIGVPLFFIHGHSEIPGKTDARWRVTNVETGEVFLDVINNFLIVNFTEQGKFDVECWVTDTNGNDSYVINRGYVTIKNRENITDTVTLTV